MNASTGVFTRTRIWPVIVGTVVGVVAAMVAVPPVSPAAAAVSPYAVQTDVGMGDTNPAMTAVDPFSEGLTPANPLKPPRPFWYSVSKEGVTIMGLRDETTGPLVVTGSPVVVHKNVKVGFVPWPDDIAITQPDGETPTDPAAEPDKFAHKPADGWKPTGMTVSYPTDEALASNSETPPTYVYVVMRGSGYEWATSGGDAAKGVDPNLRDTIRKATSPETESDLLVQVDVSDPTYPEAIYPTGPAIGAGLLGHQAGQPAFDPAMDQVYVGGMPSKSLPTTPDVPNDLTSFVSVTMMAPAELPVPGEVPAPVQVTVLCGPEHPDIPLLAGVPQAWACIGEGGEGPFDWTFTDLPPWLTAHTDPLTGQGDGILYGTPPAGTYTFSAHVDDNATTPPGTGDATITLTVTADPTTEYEYGELEWEVGTPAAVAIEGTPKPGYTGNDPCKLEPTDSPGSIVPSWVDVKASTADDYSRHIDNRSLGGPVEDTMACYVMGTPPISGERYEFQMPNFQFTWPSNNLPIVFSGQVGGPYMFDPLPKGVGLSGLAWHEIDKIHDPSTEADLLNREFFGVAPWSGDMYRIVPEYAGLEAEGTVVPPPALQGEMDEVEPFGNVLTPLTDGRADIAQALAEHPNLSVEFGRVAAEAKADPNVFVTVTRIADRTGVDPTVIPIGDVAGSTNDSAIAAGALVNVTAARDTSNPEELSALTEPSAKVIDLAGVQALNLGLDSDLGPAVRDGEFKEPGQVDHGLLMVTGHGTGNVAVVDTSAAKTVQVLDVAGAPSLGGVAFYPQRTQDAFIAGLSTQKVTIAASGVANEAVPKIISLGSAGFMAGAPGGFMVAATGEPLPALTLTGALPSGVTFTDHGDGTAMLAGTPAIGAHGEYPLTITAGNGVLPDDVQHFVLSVYPATDVQGNWVGTYGGDGYVLGGWNAGTSDLVRLRDASISLDQGARWMWADATSDVRALQSPDQSTRKAATWFDGDKVQLTLHFGSAYSGNLHLYAVDWDSTARRESITVTDSGGDQTTLLDAAFDQGAWLSFPVTAPAGGTVTITATKTAGANAVISGLFLGESSTRGNWVGTYGADGYVLGAWTGAGDLAVLPNASFSLTAGQRYVWNADTSDVRALQSPDQSIRKAATWYGNDRVSLELAFPSAYNGNLHLYAVDWDSNARREAVDVTVGSGSPQRQVLDVPFDGGVWLTYPITVGAGETVKVDVTRTAGANAVLSGIFLGDGGTTPLPPSAPEIASAAATTFIVGAAGTFQVEASGTPAPALTHTGDLPGGVTFVDHGDGTATLAGTPAAGTAKDYPITITATNEHGTVNQSFTLHVNAAAVITSADNTALVVGVPGSFSATATGRPAPALTETGALPAGVTFVDHGNGTASLAGTPAAGTAGTYPLTVKATNGVGPSASQAFTLKINEKPAITSASSVTFGVETPGTFQVTATGTPKPTLSLTGALPTGVTFDATTGRLAGTPAAGTVGTYPVTITASNGVSPDAVQSFTLTVDHVVKITTTSPLPGARVRQAYSLQFAASGGATTTYSWALVSGRLPNELRLSTTGLLSGSPRSAGTYTFAVRATDNATPTAHSATKQFSLTVRR